MAMTKKRATVVMIALVMMAAAAFAAVAQQTVTIAIPQHVIDAFGEYGIDAATLEKSYAELSWDEKEALRELGEDEEIDPILNGAIVSSLMRALPDDADAVRTRVAGTWYTHRRYVDEE